MNAARSIIRLVLAGLVLAGSTACIQMPTEGVQISDLRPQIAFRFDVNDASLMAARVDIDGADVGALADYIAGQATLKVVPGNHVVRVTRGNQVLLEERVYLGDGVARSFVVR